ncbi:SRPBCC family protein [Streptomyces sp. NP-1717]|uniref:SRPBCC family protein n=1 Tax=Streptomyces sp. NP-1717 TaxID=2704470 RepID=UPI001F5C10E8|nr:SRPBCC family protein [Streptomyces sp. NP-1717]MCI3225804.1 toxin-antitoxin system toxin subunit [Streptomyces sp. NP-1717]
MTEHPDEGRHDDHGFSSSLSAESGGRTALRMERRLAHPPQRVWDAITLPAHLAKWFPSEVSVDLRPGGEIGFHFPGEPGPGPAMTGRVTDADEPRLFAFTWGEDHLRWEITPDGDGSRLSLVHTFGDRFGAASFASGWQVCVTALGQLLDGRSVDVERDTRGTLHEAYLARFEELTRGHVEETDDGGRRVRFERQLVRPAETVWARLTGGAEPSTGSPVPSGFTADKIPAGPVTDVRAPELLAYAWHPGGEVRWELRAGTGHGPRLVLTQTGPHDDFDTEAAEAAWRARVESLAAELLDE